MLYSVLSIMLIDDKASGAWTSTDGVITVFAYCILYQTGKFNNWNTMVIQLNLG